MWKWLIDWLYYYYYYYCIRKWSRSWITHILGRKYGPNPLLQQCQHVAKKSSSNKHCHSCSCHKNCSVPGVSLIPGKLTIIASGAWNSRVYTKMETANIFRGAIVLVKLNLSNRLVPSVYNQEGTSDANVKDVEVVWELRILTWAIHMDSPSAPFSSSYCRYSCTKRRGFRHFRYIFFPTLETLHLRYSNSI